MIQLHFPSTVLGIIVYVVGLLVLWAVISIPVYFAGKALTGGRSDFGDAMGATLGGAVGYFVVYFVASFLLGAVIGDAADALATLLALLIWLGAYRVAFRTSWTRAVGIVLLAWVFLLVIDYVVVKAFGVPFPDFIPFALTA